MSENNFSKPDIRSELLRQLSQAIQVGDIASGRRLVEAAHDSLADRSDLLAGKFRCLESKLFNLSHDYQKSLASSRLAALILAPLGETEELAQAYMLTGMALINLGNYREAETAFLDAESLYRRNDSADGKLDAANQLARTCFIRGEFKNALKHLLDAVKLADQIGDQRKLAYLWGNLGRVYTLLGNFKKAIESLQLNIEVSGDLKDDKERAKALLSLGYVEMKMDHHEKAEKHFDEAYLICIHHKMRREIVIYLTYYGELRLFCKDYNASRRYLNEAIDGARAIAPESSLMVAPLRHLAQLDLECNRLNTASRLANKALVIARKVEESAEEGAVLRILAKIALAGKEDKKKTAELFAQAIEIFDEIGARFERAETLVTMAKCRFGSSRRVAASLFRAADIYRRLEITGKYEKTQELINGIDLPKSKSSNNSKKIAADATNIITVNRTMKRIIRDLGRAAQSEMPILLCGETGTGKDLMARHYHSMTGRKGRFVAVNCAAFPDTLLESELFGYRRGAFTGAVADKEGLLHRANGGTFFFDEIGEMSLAAQAKVLTVIETCQMRRLGGTSDETLDIRIIAATNQNLHDMVEDGRFRRDLYFRLNGISFTIPNLADRPEDIPVLLNHFLAKEGALDDTKKIDPALIAEFSTRSWPGNVRQLESEVKKLVLFSTLAREDSLGELAGVLVQNDNDGQTASLFNQVEQFERSLILRALKDSDWNKSKAARSLAIHESTLRAKMKRYELRANAAS